MRRGDYILLILTIALIAGAMLTEIGRAWRSRWSEESARRAGLLPAQALDTYAESAAAGE
jgi:Kef-type K+ transport system membrane component KefB